MSDEQPPGFIDRVIDLLAHALDALGLNGTRLRWKWNQKRRALGDAGARGEQMMRSAKGKHKMCRSCRALVSRSATTCPECGESLGEVRAPGAGRALGNIFPGMSSATSLLLLVNGFWFAMMVIAQTKSGTAGGGLMVSFDSDLLVRFGSGLSRPVLLPSGDVAGGEWWRLVTPIFLHGGMLHFFFNSYVLLQLGPIVEEIYGTERFWVIYLGAGLTGSLASQLPRFVNTVGASGAIMGLMGLLLVFGWRRGGALGQSLKSSMIRFGVYILIFSLVVPGIDHLNHAGGFVCGALAALLVPSRETGDRSNSAIWQGLSLVGVMLVLFAFYQVAMFGRSTG